MEYILETNNLRKDYKDFKVLNELNIHIKKGSIYGLIGKNGAGKTTLIRIICGLQRPTNGSYYIYGVENTDNKVTKERQRIGAIIESPSIRLEMSAEDNLLEQCKIIGITNFNNVKNILKLVGLSNTGKKKAKNFSLGMKQRLGIAISLVGNPDFLILDEPINGLDPEGIIEIRELILKLNKEKKITFLISSHYLDELSKIATDYGFLNKGKIIKEISKKELQENSKKRIEIKVSNIKNVVCYLEEKNLPYEVVSDCIINIYESVSISELAIELSKKDCVIKEFKEKEETLENYYINLIGGNRNE